MLNKVMKKTPTMIPIYTTRGDVGAILVYPYIYNSHGEWIGWVSAEREVYSVHGHYVGWLSDDPRILRKHATAYGRTRLKTPPPPPAIHPPATFPLAPMMPELKIGTFDVLLEEPDLMPSIDTGDLKEDLD